MDFTDSKHSFLDASRELLLDGFFDILTGERLEFSEDLQTYSIFFSLCALERVRMILCGEADIGVVNQIEKILIIKIVKSIVPNVIFMYERANKGVVPPWSCPMCAYYIYILYLTWWPQYTGAHFFSRPCELTICLGRFDEYISLQRKVCHCNLNCSGKVRYLGFMYSNVMFKKDIDIGNGILEYCMLVPQIFLTIQK